MGRSSANNGSPLDGRRDDPAAICSHALPYRADIDGLRAIAVLAVVSFHLLPGSLAGGFLGVDVFFVISGYLIAQILVRDCEAGEFSLLRFYERRIRRIMPALLVVVTATTAMVAAAWLPSDAVGYARSVFAAFAFVANVYFWRDTGYFADAAATKPLLHTWSLGIEEQFYLLFPLLVWAFMRVGGRRAVFWGVAGLSAASFTLAAYAELVLKSLPAFYLLPMRAWELGVGAALAAAARPVAAARATMTAAAGAGLVLLAAALARLHPAFALPLPPPALACAGTALLIWAGRGDNRVSRLLAARPLVAIGLVSYSLYLWHWPIYVFGRYVLVREPTLAEALAMIVLAAALAAISWRWVERPFRDRSMPARRVLAIVGGATALLSLAAGALLWSGGAPQRFDPRVVAFDRVAGTHFRCAVTDYIPFGALYACPMALPDRDPATADVALFGNSHAQMYAPAVAAALERRGEQGLLVPVNACLPTTAVNISARCIEVVERNLAALVALRNVTTVIVATTWPGTAERLVDARGRRLGAGSQGRYLEDLSATIDRFRAAGKRVVVVAPIPEPGYDVASVAARELAFQGAVTHPLGQSRGAYDARYAAALAWLQPMQARVTVVRPADVLCDRAACRYVLGGDPVYADDDHLSQLAMPRFVPLFAEALSTSEEEAR